MTHDRSVAGIRCSGVLAVLPDYVEGELEPTMVERVESHLRGCDWCERFGGHYAATVVSLRRELAEPPPLAADVRARLLTRLDDTV